ncbi:MAG TPA: hypothetical protein VJY35_00890 [Candidatus Eisenbacteria bacterium]|nr:hypothetical protein [Candidatus Eisenbacteria bacterium]
MFKRTSPKYLEALESLPEELRPIYHRLVEEYAFHTDVSYGRGYVAYRVLAALVRDGWRPTEDGGPPNEHPATDQSTRRT